MLRPSGDDPRHRTGRPIAPPATGDRDQDGGWSFNGFDRDGGSFFAAALGVHPDRRIIDAALSRSHDGVQRSVHASGTAPLDRNATRVGPLRLEVVEPLRTRRVVVDALDSGIVADVPFDACTAAVEGPHNTSHDRVLATGRARSACAGRGVWLLVETTAEFVGCHGCGTRAVGHGRERLVPGRHRPSGFAGLLDGDEA